LTACICSEFGEVCFGVYVRNNNRKRTPPLVRLKAVGGPGEPVIMAMLPEKD
jgi:hypothetical protein